MGRYADREITEHRLRTWRRLSGEGLRVADIAVHLRMTRAALDQLVYRQRKDGNPLAVYHPDARFTDPDPSPRKLAARLAARHRDRRRTAERAQARTV